VTSRFLPSVRVRRLSTAGIIAAALFTMAGFIPPAFAASSVTEKQYGFSFSLPSRWQQIPLDSRDIGTILKAATKDDPGLANVLDSQVEQAAKQGIKVFAVGPLTGAAFPNLNVAVESSSGSPTGSAFLTAAAAEVKIVLTESGAQHLSVHTVRFAVGEVLEATYQLRLKTSKQPLEGLQLYIEHGAYVYVVTASSLSAKEDQSVITEVTNSWRWI
jgi:hypothetical protein